MVETISQRLPVTVKLTVVAVVFETVLGITAGILAALRRNSFFDNLVLVSTTVLVSIPVFVLGFLAQYLFRVQTALAADRRDRRRLGQLPAARSRAGRAVDGLCGPADQNRDAGGVFGRLHPHRAGQRASAGPASCCGMRSATA